MKPKRVISKFIRDESGASIVYVTVIAAVLIGFFGMSLDFGRVYMTNSQAKAAADAIALAAASQLDGQSDAITRATNAAGTTLGLINRETYADKATANAPIVISSLRFLDSLPASDATPIDASYVTTVATSARFVEVTTEDLQHTNIFLTAVGTQSSTTTRGVAVAGFTQTICLPTPLMMCNPNEAPTAGGTGAGFNIGNWRGRQIAARTQGPGSQLAPGTFGFLDSAAGNSASALGEMLASVNGLPTCTQTDVDVRPGNPNSVRNALNVRFDMYDNPGFGGNASNEARYRPAANVTKGRVWTGPSANPCNSFDDANPATASLGRDTNMSATQRIGNGQWDCAAYWAINHPAHPIPPGCSTAGGNTMTRYQTYRYEIDNGIIPNQSPTLENGNPQCHADAASIVDDPGNDRRVIYLAVVNCVEHNLRGNRDDVPAIAVLKTFLTEPAGDENTPGNNDFDVYLEIVDEIITGADDGVLHDIVQLYR